MQLKIQVLESTNNSYLSIAHWKRQLGFYGNISRNIFYKAPLEFFFYKLSSLVFWNAVLDDRLKKVLFVRKITSKGLLNCKVCVEAGLRHSCFLYNFRKWDDPKRRKTTWAKSAQKDVFWWYYHTPPQKHFLKSLKKSKSTR